jgi:hypothetical protein
MPVLKSYRGGQTGEDILLTKNDPEAVAFELGLRGGVSAGVSPADYFVWNPGRFRMLHVKHFVRRPEPIFSLAKDQRPQGAELGPTAYRLQADSFAAAPKAGIKGYYTEPEPPFISMTAMEAVGVDYRYLRAI